MIVSLNELEAAARKAFRGAGYHWGEAEEAGKAAVWLARRGLPGGSVIVDLLKAAGGSGGGDCPLRAGIALADGAARLSAPDVIVIEELRSPLLLLPFLSQAAADTGFELKLSASGLEATVSPAGVEVTLLPAAGNPAAATLSVTAGGPSATASDLPHHPAEIPQDIWQELNAFAALTYVPASEHSRIAGAGAGLADND